MKNEVKAVESPLHSKLAPSAASRWVACPASVDFIRRNADILPKESSVYADEGTKAHQFAADVLTGKTRLIPSDDAEMLTHVRAYVDFVREKVTQSGDKLYVERRVPLFYLPAQHGTVDAAIIGKKRIYIADLKYGAGVSVYAKENKQLSIYAESLIQEMEVLEPIPDETLVTLAIFQPRDRNDPNPIRLWAINRGQLRQFTSHIEKAAHQIIETRGEGLNFNPDPDKQCLFCPAKGICKAYAAYGLSVITDAPVDVAIEQTITLPDPASLTREQRMKVIAMRKGLEKWLGAVEEQEVNELKAGTAPLAYKLVAGKSNRQWIDEDKAVEVLAEVLEADEYFPRTLVSPAQAEKLLKSRGAPDGFSDRFESVITKPAGNPTLVPVDDKRPALEFNPTADLVDVDVI